MTEVETRRPRAHTDPFGIAAVLAIILVTVIVTWFLAAAALGVGVGNSAPSSSTSPGGGSTNTSTPAPSNSPDYLYLYIDGDPDINQSFDVYTPANFTVPAHTLVIVQITNYDPGENPVTPHYAVVNGTVGNLEYINASKVGNHTVNNLTVAHTFSIVYGPYAGFNVPIPAAGPYAPTVVTFDTYFNVTGSFTWNCMAPCSPVSMDNPGFMQGTITVAG